MITKDVKIRVRYKDTDKMGVVYHSNYIVYYEVARTEMLRELDIPYSEMEAQGVMMPILEIESKYIAPAYYDEEITVRAIIDAEPMARINVRYEVINEAGTDNKYGTYASRIRKLGDPSPVPRAEAVYR